MELVKDLFIVILGATFILGQVVFFLGQHFFFFFLFEDNLIIHLLPSIIDVSDKTT